MSKIKRYRLIESDQGLRGVITEMEEHNFGEWVKFDDAYKIIEWYKNKIRDKPTEGNK